eukprot:tig00021357_g20748.t1
MDPDPKRLRIGGPTPHLAPRAPPYGPSSASGASWASSASLYFTSPSSDRPARAGLVRLSLKLENVSTSVSTWAYKIIVRSLVGAESLIVKESITVVPEDLLEIFLPGLYLAEAFVIDRAHDAEVTSIPRASLRFAITGEDGIWFDDLQDRIVIASTAYELLLQMEARERYMSSKHPDVVNILAGEDGLNLMMRNGRGNTAAHQAAIEVALRWQTGGTQTYRDIIEKLMATCPRLAEIENYERKRVSDILAASPAYPQPLSTPSPAGGHVFPNGFSSSSGGRDLSGSQDNPMLKPATERSQAVGQGSTSQSGSKRKNLTGDYFVSGERIREEVLTDFHMAGRGPSNLRCMFVELYKNINQGSHPVTGPGMMLMERRGNQGATGAVLIGGNQPQLYELAAEIRMQALPDEFRPVISQLAIEEKLIIRGELLVQPPEDLPQTPSGWTPVNSSARGNEPLIMGRSERGVRGSAFQQHPCIAKMLQNGTVVAMATFSVNALSSHHGNRLFRILLWVDISNISHHQLSRTFCWGVSPAFRAIARVPAGFIPKTPDGIPLPSAQLPTRNLLTGVSS